MKFITNAFWWLVGLLLLVSIGYGFYSMYRNGFSIALVVLVAIYLLTTTFSLVLFSQKRNNPAKLSWLIVMIVLPIFGHIIFFAFGQRFKYRQTQEEYLKNELFKLEDFKEKPSNTILNKQSNVTKREIRNADFEVLSDGINSYNAIFKELRKAKKYIFIEQYIVHKGEVWDELREILINKSREGVEVKMIIDDFGRWALPWYEIKSLEKEGVKIVIFGKVTYPFISSKNGYRTHRKMFIVDGKTAFVGGMNIGDEYANIDKNYGKWLDLQVKVNGELIKSILLLFLHDWKIVSKETLNFATYYSKQPSNGKSKAVLVEDSPEVIEPILANSIVQWITNAKKTITLTTPYFIPTANIMEALITAAKSGVEVKVIIPGRVDKNYIKSVSLHWVSQLIIHGVKFYKTNDQLLHSKIGIFDSEYAYFGTANIDMRSAYAQFEYILLAEGKVVKDLNNTIDSYLRVSKEVKSEDIKVSWWKKKIIRIYALLLSPVM